MEFTPEAKGVYASRSNCEIAEALVQVVRAQYLTYLKRLFAAWYDAHRIEKLTASDLAHRQSLSRDRAMKPAGSELDGTEPCSGIQVSASLQYSKHLFTSTKLSPPLYSYSMLAGIEYRLRLNS